MFDGIVGNDSIKGYLVHLVERDRVGNCLLFAGPDGVGKGLFAKAFAKMVLSCNGCDQQHLFKLNAGIHPDLHIYRPEGKSGMHSIASIRALIEEVYLPPHEAKRKVFIIHDADRMLPYSSNALLKTLEEPSLETVIILVSSSAELLLPTILSRCSTFRFHTVVDEEIVKLLMDQKKLSAEEAKRIAGISQGSISRAYRLSETAEDPLRKKVLDMLSAPFTSYSSLVAKAKELAEMIEQSVKVVQSAAREELTKNYSDKLSATQRESVEKEVEGIASVHQMREAEGLFDLILSWQRDLHLLVAGGDKRYLFNPDYISALEARIGKGNALLPLDVYFESIKNTKLALARATSLNLCLENLFMRLDMV